MRLSKNDTVTWRLLDDHMSYIGTVDHESSNSLVVISENPVRETDTNSFAVISTKDGCICAKVEEISDARISFTKLHGDRRSRIRVDDMLSVSVRKASPAGPYFSGSIPLDRMGLQFPEFPVFAQPDDPITRALSVINRKLDFLLSHVAFQGEGIFPGIPRRTNLSASGIRIDLHFHTDPDDILEVKIMLPLSAPVLITVYGSAVRVREKVESYLTVYETAINFLKMSDEVRDMIIEYTIQRQREIIHNLRECD